MSLIYHLKTRLFNGFSPLGCAAPEEPEPEPTPEDLERGRELNADRKAQHRRRCLIAQHFFGWRFEEEETPEQWVAQLSLPGSDQRDVVTLNYEWGTESHRVATTPFVPHPEWSPKDRDALVERLHLHGWRTHVFRMHDGYVCNLQKYEPVYDTFQAGGATAGEAVANAVCQLIERDLQRAQG